MPTTRPTQADYEHLKLLGILTIVHGALQAFAGLVTFAYMCFVGFVTAVSDSDSSSTFAGGFVAICGLLIGGLFVAKGAFLAFSGWGLVKHERRALSYVGAVLACIDVPIGTVLAVFTFIVLDRPGVRAIYAGATAAAPAAPVHRTTRHDAKPDSPLRVRVAS